MHHLAIDLGTSCGFAVGSNGVAVSGNWNLKAGRFEGGGMRFVTFRKYLNEIHAAFRIDRVFFEEVRRHRGVDAAHVYGGLMAVLTEWCEENEIPYTAFPVGEIKKQWTGSGNASKEMMIAEAQRRGFSPQTDDEADALAIFHLSLVKFGSAGAPSQAAMAAEMRA